MYASYLISADSEGTLPCSEAYFKILFEPIGREVSKFGEFDGDRQGKSLASYVITGNRSKRCFIGAGIEKKSLVRLVTVDGDGPELGVRCCSLSSVAISNIP